MSLPYFPFYAGDFVKDTMHLTPCEIGAYTLFLCHIWNVGPIHEDRLHVVARMHGDAWSIAQASLKHLLRQDENGLWFSPRLAREKMTATEKHAKASAKASKAANKRWSDVREAKAKKAAELVPPADPGMLGALLEHCQPEPDVKKHASPSTSFQGKGGAAAAAPSGLTLVGEAKAKTLKNERVTASKRAAGESDGAVPPEDNQDRQAVLHPMQHAALVLGSTGNGKGRRDARFDPFKDELKSFRKRLSGTPAFNKNDGLALVEYLRDRPDLDLAGLRVRLDHREQAVRACMEHPQRAGNPNPHDSIAAVLAKLDLYTDGPVNTFGDPLAPVRPSGAGIGLNTETPEAADQRVRQRAEMLADKLNTAASKYDQVKLSAAAVRLRDLAGGIGCKGPHSIEELDAALQGVEDKVVVELLSTTPELKLSELRAAAAQEMKPYRGRMERKKLQELERGLVHSKLLQSYALPRLNMLSMAV